MEYFSFKASDNDRPTINLSKYAWYTLESDKHTFYDFTDSIDDATLINRIIQNFARDSSASVPFIKEKLEQDFDRVINESPTLRKHQENTKRGFRDCYINNQTKRIEERFVTEKHQGKKIFLNKDTIDILDSDEFCSIAQYYFGNKKDEKKILSLYLKNVLEDYTEKPSYIREQIFFKNIIKTFEEAKKDKKRVKLKTKPKHREFYFSPYEIKQDDTNSFNYLTGYGKEIIIDENNNVVDTEERVASIRITNIEKIEIVKSPPGGFISEDKKQRLEKKIDSVGVQYLTYDSNSPIKVKFSPFGIKKLNSIIYQRPKNFKEISSEENIYEFYCSEQQAINYFSRFGWDAIVIEPIEVVDEIKKNYKRAIQRYEGKTHKEILAEEKDVNR